MWKKAQFLTVLAASAAWLSGCSLMRVTGPCYGVGCPSFTSSGTQKTAASSQPAGGNAQAQQSAAATAASAPAAESSQAAPAQSEAGPRDTAQAKPGTFTRMLTAMHLHPKS